MRGFYFFHLATGVILIAALVVFFNSRNDSLSNSPNDAAGSSGTIESVSAGGTGLSLGLPPRGDSEPLTFVNQFGEPVSELDFRGGYSLVFFGYTNCPDVCPGSLAAMSRALTILGSEAEQVQPIFISFDPDRDTPEVLKSYVSHFHPRLIGLTGTQAEIDSAARAYGVFFERGESTDSGAGGGEIQRTIQHTSNTYLVGPQGRALAIFRHNTPPDEMVATIREKLQKSQGQNPAALP